MRSKKELGRLEKEQQHKIRRMVKLKAKRDIIQLK
jgi:hypothetical protein